MQCLLQVQARRPWNSNSKDPESPVTFREGILKAMWGMGLQDAWSTHAQFSEGLALKWSFKHHQLSGFNQSSISVLVLAVFIWCGSASYKTTQECMSGLYLYLLGNWEFGDSARWLVYNLNCYKCVCFFSPNSYSLFLPFHILQSLTANSNSWDSRAARETKTNALYFIGQAHNSLHTVFTLHISSVEMAWIEGHTVKGEEENKRPPEALS